MSGRILPYIFVLLAAILWGTVGTAKTYLPEEAGSISIAMFRSLLGGILLLLVALFLRKIRIKNWSWKLSIYASISMALFQPLFFTAVQVAGVAIGTVVTIGSSPIFAGMIDWFIRKKRPNRVWGFATVLAIMGCVLLFIGQESNVIHPWGIFSALSAGLAFAVYTNISKSLLKKEESLATVAIVFTVTGLLLLPFSLRESLVWSLDYNNWWPLIMIAFFGTSIAYLLFFRGLRVIDSSSAVTLSLAEPLTAALLGVFLVGEYLSFQGWLGVVLLLGGIVIVSFKNLEY